MFKAARPGSESPEQFSDDHVEIERTVPSYRSSLLGVLHVSPFSPMGPSSPPCPPPQAFTHCLCPRVMQTLPLHCLPSEVPVGSCFCALGLCPCKEGEEHKQGAPGGPTGSSDLDEECDCKGGGGDRPGEGRWGQSAEVCAEGRAERRPLKEPGVLERQARAALNALGSSNPGAGGVQTERFKPQKINLSESSQEYVNKYGKTQEPTG